MLQELQTMENWKIEEGSNSFDDYICLLFYLLFFLSSMFVRGADSS
jgi:hypothetical protein